MSHFIGLVFLHPAADLDQVLEPFNEQNEEYMEFNDCTDEVKAKWKEVPDSCPSEGTYTKVEDMTDEINQIGVNFNQLVRKVNTTGVVSESDLREAKRTNQQVLHLMREWEKTWR